MGDTTYGMTEEDWAALLGEEPREASDLLPPTGLEGVEPNAPFDPTGLEAYAAPDSLTNLSPEDYFGQFTTTGPNEFMGPINDDPFGILGYQMEPEPMRLAENKSDPLGLSGYKMDTSPLGIDTRYGGSDDSPKPSPTGDYAPTQSSYDKWMERIFGKEGTKPGSSPASSMSGIASNAAAKAAEARAAEARILLEQDRNRISAEQLNLLREKYLRKQKALSRYRAGDRASNKRTPEEKAAARLDEQTYDPFSPVPENKLPGSPWWEKMLAAYGIAGGMAGGKR